MRIIAYILLLCLAILTVVPCADGILFSDTDSEVLITESSPHHSDHADMCTPLCVCACCGVSITLPSNKIMVEEEPIVIPTQYIFSYEFEYSFDYIKRVWHPPNLS